LISLVYGFLCPTFPHEHLLLFVVVYLLLMIATLMDEMESQCSLIYISYVAKDAEYFFMYLLIIFTSFENCLLFCLLINWIV
jgi:hypothetical protein